MDFASLRERLESTRSIFDQTSTFLDDVEKRLRLADEAMEEVRRAHRNEVQLEQTINYLALEAEKSNESARMRENRIRELEIQCEEEKALRLDVEMRCSTVHKNLEEVLSKKDSEIKVLQLEVERAQSSRNQSEKKLMEMAVRVTNIVQSLQEDANVQSSPQVENRDRTANATTPRSASNEIRHTMFPFVNRLFHEQSPSVLNHSIGDILKQIETKSDARKKLQSELEDLSIFVVDALRDTHDSLTHRQPSAAAPINSPPQISARSPELILAGAASPHLNNSRPPNLKKTNFENSDFLRRNYPTTPSRRSLSPGGEELGPKPKWLPNSKRSSWPFETTENIGDGGTKSAKKKYRDLRADYGVPTLATYRPHPSLNIFATVGAPRETLIPRESVANFRAAAETHFRQLQMMQLENTRDVEVLLASADSTWTPNGEVSGEPRRVEVTTPTVAEYIPLPGSPGTPEHIISVLI